MYKQISTNRPLKLTKAHFGTRALPWMTMYLDLAGFQLEAILSPAFGMLGLHLGIANKSLVTGFNIAISVVLGSQPGPLVCYSKQSTQSSLPSPLFCFCEIQSEVTQASLKFLILLISLPEYEPTFDLCNSGDQINPKHHIRLTSTYARQALY